MDIELINSVESFLKLEAEWNTLLAKSHCDEVCHTFEWIRAWWTAFGGGSTLSIIVVRHQGQTIAIAPLMKTRRRFLGLAVEEVGFIGNDNSPRSDFIVRAGTRGVIASIIAFLSGETPCTVMNFRNIPVDSPTYKELREAVKGRGLAWGVKSGLRSPFIKIAGEDWEGYFKQRSKRFRKSLRSSCNRVKNSGCHEFNCIERAQDSTDVEAAFGISDKCWKARYRGHIGSCEGNKVFFSELTKIASERKWLLLWFLSINGRAVAYEYHLRYKGVAYALRADFHQDFAHISPGSVLNSYIIEQYFKNGIGLYDMCGHEDAYKKNWTNDIRSHAIVQVYCRSILSRLMYVAEFKFIHPLKTFLNSVWLVRRLKRLLLGRY